MGVARLLPPTPFVGGLDWCWPPGVQDEPSDDAPEVEDKGEDDPSWIDGDEAELGTVVDDKSEEVVDKSENNNQFENWIYIIDNGFYHLVVTSKNWPSLDQVTVISQVMSFP